MKKLLIYIFALFGVVILSTSCNSNDDVVTPTDYSAAQEELKSQYPDATNITWSTSRGYHVAKFATTSAQDMAAWYTVVGQKATVEMVTTKIPVSGNVVPDEIDAAFKATKYADATKWTITEIELEDNYDDAELVVKTVYEVELENIANSNLEAKLYFDATTTPGKLLYSKEELDDDDDDDDKVVIDDNIINSVENAIIPTLFGTSKTFQIVSAEYDDDLIEVEVVIIDGGVVVEEVELNLDPITYAVVGTETETTEKTTYLDLDDTFKTPIIAWFAKTANSALPKPSDTDAVEIETNTINGVITYDVEIEYTTGGHEAEFKFNATYVITEGEVEN